MLNRLSLGFEFREAKEFFTHFTAMFCELSPRTRDGQNVTATCMSYL